MKELVEGENDGDDEMFWMVVGDPASYAKADYWKWRSSRVPPEPRCWLVDVANSEASVSVCAPRCPNANPPLDPSSSDRVRRDCTARFSVHHRLLLGVLRSCG